MGIFTDELNKIKKKIGTGTVPKLGQTKPFVPTPYVPKKKVAPMEFRVGEGLNAEQAKIANETVRKVDPYVTPAPFSFMQSLSLFRDTVGSEVAKKQGKPYAGYTPSPEERKEVFSSIINPTFGATSGLVKGFTQKATPELLEYLAKTKSAPEIEKEIVKLGIKPEVAKVYAPKLAGTNTVDEVKNVLMNETSIVPKGQNTPKVSKLPASVTETPFQALARSEAYAKQAHPTMSLKKVPSEPYPYNLSKKGVDTVYHETSPQEGRNIIFSSGEKRGLNVSTSQELALGQGGKGVTIEFSTNRIEGNKIAKPGADFLASQNGKYPEYQISNAPPSLTPDVKSVTFDQPLSPLGERNFFGFRENWKATKEVLPNGKVKYTNPGTSTSLKSDIRTGKPIRLTPREQALVGTGTKNVPFIPKPNSTQNVDTTSLGQLGTFPKIQPTSLSRESTMPTSGGVKPNLPVAPSYPHSIQQKILNARQAREKFDEFLLSEGNEIEPIVFPEQIKQIRKMASKMNLGEKARTYKDIGNIKKQFRNIKRNSEQVFGKDFPTIDKGLFVPLDQSKRQLYNFWDNELASLEKDITKKYGWKQGGKESADIELYGEGKIKKEDLVKKYGEVKAKQITEALTWFRERYNDLILNKLNPVEQWIYPNNPEKWTPTLKNYFSHGRNATNEFSRLQNILENPIRIDPMLVGKSEGTKPLTKWQSFKQQRFGQKHDPDAIGGYINYLSNIGHSIYIDPNVGRFRELAEVLRRRTTKSKNLNNYIYNVEMFANELSGKTSELDRIVTEYVPGGRTSLEVVNWVNNRAKANVILFNASSSLAQIYNVPQGISSAGKINSLKALKTTLGQNFVKNELMKDSIFIKERYYRKFNKFDVGMLNNTRKVGVWLVSALDEAGTKFIWNGQIEKARSLGITKRNELIKFADNATDKLVAGRGIGQKPLIQSSKVFQLAAPFTHELTNLWWVMGDMAKAKKFVLNPKTGSYEEANRARQALSKFNAFATLFVSLYLLNSATEKATGNRLALDPIQMTLDGVEELKQGNIAGAGGRVAGEFLSNIPLGQTIASIYPEYGPKIGGIKFPTREKFFGDKDPTRFGGGLLTAKSLADPLYKIIPPFGGGQAKKTIEGFQDIQAGQHTDSSGRAQYDVGGTPLKDAQALIFGKYSGAGAQDYYENDTTYAEATLKNIQKLGKEKGKVELAKIIKENPALWEGIQKVLKKQALGITDNDQKLLNMGVATKQRAKEVAKQLNKLDTKEKKKALMAEYLKKKIITLEVAGQLKEFLNK